MPNVVTSENIVEVIANGGRAPEFKAPEAKPAEGKAAPDSSQKPNDGKTERPENGTTVQPRKADGTFDSPTGEKPAEKGKAAPQPAVDDDPDGENLTEHARRVIAKKHRKQKEAEEFATQEARRALSAEARAEALQRELDSLKGGKKSGDGPATSADDDPKRPKKSDFETVGDYTEALTEYLVEKKAKAAGEASKAQSEQDRAKAAAEEIAGTFATRQQEFMKATPDYEEVVGDSELDMPNAGMQYLVESEMGPQLAYHLAKNPKEAERLSSLSPTRVIAELGKLEARLESAKPKEAPKGEPAPQNTRQVSRAPAPVSPLSGESATAVEKDPSQMSFQELRALREKQKQAGQWRA